MRTTTRYRKLAAASAALACLSVLPAWGIDLRDCDSPDPGRRIEACTAILHRGKDKAAWGGAYNNRAGAFMAKGDYDRALADYDMAVQLNPEVAAGWLNRGTHGLERKTLIAPSPISRRRSSLILRCGSHSIIEATPGGKRESIPRRKTISIRRYGGRRTNRVRMHFAPSCGGSWGISTRQSLTWIKPSRSFHRIHRLAKVRWR